MGFGFGGLICARLIDVLVPFEQEFTIPKTVQQVNLDEPIPLNKFEFVQMHFEQPEQAASLLARNPINDDTEVQKVLIYEKKKIAYAFIILGLLYACVMVPSSLYIAPPPKEWVEAYMQGINSKAKAAVTTKNELSARQAVRTFGFYGLWIMLFINVSCGIALIATAKKMGYEMVHLSASMSTWLVMGISLFNGLGRIFWASISDFIGRSNTYIVFFGLQVLAFPLLANITANPTLFTLVTFIILTCYGGGFASIPAYISDLFGVKEMPTIHGYILTAWSLAGICGPTINSFVYERTQSYQMSLYIFGSAFVVALVVSLLMKIEIKRLKRHYSKTAADGSTNELKVA